LNLVRDETKYARKMGFHHTTYQEQLSRHDSFLVEPKQLPELLLNQCPDSVIVHEQSPQKIGSPALIEKRERDPVAMNKNDAILPKKHGKNVVSKSKKDSLPQTSVTPPFIVKFKLARNTNKKTKATDRNISKKKKEKPFMTVLARMEKRRMLVTK